MKRTPHDKNKSNESPEVTEKASIPIKEDEEMAEPESEEALAETCKEHWHQCGRLVCPCFCHEID